MPLTHVTTFNQVTNDSSEMSSVQSGEESDFFQNSRKKEATCRSLKGVLLSTFQCYEESDV